MLTYPPKHNYWKYLNQLISELKATKCDGIREKIADIDNNSSKVNPTISELEIARILSKLRKNVKLLPDNYISSTTASPDMLVEDHTGDYVEVRRFSDDETSGIIIDELRSFLAESTPRCRVDVSLPENLSLPANDHKTRGVKQAKVKEVLVNFKARFDEISLDELPTQITVDKVVFEVSASDLSIGYPGLVNTSVIKVPTQEFVKIIQYIVNDKGSKRLQWTGEDLKRRYIVAIDSDQLLMDENELFEALIGSGHYYQPLAPDSDLRAQIMSQSDDLP